MSPRELLITLFTALCLSAPVPAAQGNRLEVLPAAVVLATKGSSQQLLVTERSTGLSSQRSRGLSSQRSRGLSSQRSRGDGERDRTLSCVYTSSDPAVVTVSPEGLLLARASGTARVTIRSGGIRVLRPGLRVSERVLETHVTITVRTDDHRQARFGDVVPLLTKHSCNSGGCHGKATGQNGFKLSLLGFEPAFDFDAIAMESFGRRVVPASPRRSLLLRKATGSLPHGGGERLAVDSEDYRVLEEWIRRGAPPPTPDDPVVERIIVTPSHRVLASDSRQQLLVTASFSDGETRDVTRQAIYQSNEPAIAGTTASGVVEVAPGESGLFAIMVRFGDKLGVFHGTVPYASPSETLAEQYPQALHLAAEQSLVDRNLLASWQRLGVAPSPPAPDEVFLRRITLDLCGTLPTAKEVSGYLDDPTPDKRARWIDGLLERPEYASYFAIKWADILQNRGRGYGTSKQRHGTAFFTDWIRDALAANQPYDQFVSDIITATGSQAENPPTIWYRHVRNTVDYVESISQAFLGVRVQCAQCHHHPAERWSQADYYGLAAVFARVGRKGGFADGEVPTDETVYLKSAGEITHPRTGKVMQPQPLGDAPFDLGPFDDPRQSLARWMTARDNPFFARAMVNRMWGHFFGRGIVHPIDDARSTNPPSHPELLDALAAEFVESGYDIKHLIRTIANSYAYSLSSAPTSSNEGDRQSFARFYPRRLPAEVILDAFSQVLDVPTEFPGGVGNFPLGTRAIELPDENVAVNFLDVFGRPARTSACECERVVAPSLHQALELVNSSEIQKKLTAEKGYVERLAAREASHEENVRDVFMRALARRPRPEELAGAVDFLNGESDRREGYRTLLWSILATNEFLFNL